MLSKPHRFHGHNSLNGVYRNGRTVHGSLLQVRFVQRGGQRPYQVAVVVSKKVHKSAVVRNRIRRRIFEIVRQLEQPLSAGQSVIITVFNVELATMEAAKLRAMVRGALRKTTNR